MKIDDVPGRSLSFLVRYPGTRGFIGWITNEYLGIRTIIPDREQEFVNLEFKFKKFINQEYNLLIVIVLGISWIILD